MLSPLKLRPEKIHRNRWEWLEQMGLTGCDCLLDLCKYLLQESSVGTCWDQVRDWLSLVGLLSAGGWLKPTTGIDCLEGLLDRVTGNKCRGRPLDCWNSVGTDCCECLVWLLISYTETAGRVQEPTTGLAGNDRWDRLLRVLGLVIGWLELLAPRAGRAGTGTVTNCWATALGKSHD